MIDVIEILRDQEQEIKEKFGVKRIGVFGSSVRGELKDTSDIDLVVDFDLTKFGENFSGLYDAYINLSSYLEDLFGKKRKVDILTPISVETIRVKDVQEKIKSEIVYV